MSVTLVELLFGEFNAWHLICTDLDIDRIKCIVNL